MGRVETLPGSLAGGDARALLALAGGTAFVGVGTWLVLARHPRLGGAAAAGAGVLLMAGSLAAGERDSRLLRFVESAADRAFDGSLLPAIVLSMRHVDHEVAAVALAALAVTFLAAYIRARGAALRYQMGESRAVQAARYALVAIGLLGHWLLATMSALLVLGMVTAVVQTRNVARQGK